LNDLGSGVDESLHQRRPMRDKGGMLEVRLEDILVENVHVRVSESLQSGRYLKLTVKDSREVRKVLDQGK
jgi:hypothetical protein